MEPFQMVLFGAAVLLVLFMLYKTGVIDRLAMFAERELWSHFQVERNWRRYEGRNCSRDDDQDRGDWTRWCDRNQIRSSR